ncbi:nucleotidyltransferase domain-containing protein [Marinilactibacillus kalidii]|uniref:nucleotidyltransferase domain-containing protein n=1 Tax=Marinilactibacillus kalidii TaxID=2820274 RepID=UPI001ABE189C|nr:nucleotidyltransferase domain-containing protein [Marinilactibacillus kalidii]
MDERTRYLEALLQQLKESVDIQAIFLGGSLANGTADDYSDIDLRIIVSDLVDRRSYLEAFVASQPDILFVENLSRTYTVVHFKAFFKLDLFAYKKEEVIASTWLNRITIIKDTHDQYLAKIKDHSKTLVFEPTQELFNQLMNKYIAYLHEGYRKGQRGAMLFVEQCLLHMKHILLSLYRLLAKQEPNSLGDWSKYEGPHSRFTVEQTASIRACRLNGEKTLADTIQALNHDVRKHALLLAREQGLTFDAEMFDEACQLVDFQGISLIKEKDE